jgi:hypothetical protein
VELEAGIMASKALKKLLKEIDLEKVTHRAWLRGCVNGMNDMHRRIVAERPDLAEFAGKILNEMFHEHIGAERSDFDFIEGEKAKLQESMLGTGAK